MSYRKTIQISYLSFIAILLVLALSVSYAKASPEKKTSEKKLLYDQWKISYNEARNFYSSDIEEAIVAALNAKDIAMRLKDVELIGKSHWMAGWLYRRKGDLVNSFNYYLGARRAFLRLKDWDKVEQLEENLGSVALDNRSYSTAIKRWKDRLETAKKLDDKRVANAHFDLGLAYKHNGQHTLALEHFTTARALYKVDYRYQDSTRLARTFNEIGILYKSSFVNFKSWKDSALINFQRALQLDKSYTMQSMVANNIGNIHKELMNYEKALSFYKKALELEKKSNNKRLKIKFLTNIGHTYYLMDMPDSCLAYLTQVIHMEYGGPQNNHSDLLQMLEMDMSENLILSVQLVDSLQIKYPKYVSNVDHLTLLETVSKIKMNMTLLESRDRADLIELASQEMEAEMRKALFWAEVKFWGILLITIAVAILLIYRLVLWYQIKKAAQLELDRIKRSDSGMLSQTENL